MSLIVKKSKKSLQQTMTKLQVKETTRKEDAFSGEGFAQSQTQRDSLTQQKVKLLVCGGTVVCITSTETRISSRLFGSFTLTGGCAYCQQDRAKVPSERNTVNRTNGCNPYVWSLFKGPGK